MTFRNKLWITGAVMAGLALPASAQGIEPNSNASAAAQTWTYFFPATGFGPSETIRIAAVNIAQTAHDGAKPACNVTLGFNDDTGKPIPMPSSVTTTFNLGTGQIGTVDLPNAPSNKNLHVELQGVVQLTVNPSAQTPCSAMLTLEIFDTTTGVTHSIVSTVVTQQPLTTGFGTGIGR